MQTSYLECRTIKGQKKCKSEFKSQYGKSWRKYWKAWKKSAKGKEEKAQAILSGKLKDWRKENSAWTKIKGVAEWVLLAPFKAAMILMLKSKGVSKIPKGIGNIARLFNEVVLKKHAAAYDIRTFDSHTSYIDPVTITLIVTAIIKLFKAMADAKAKGEELPQWMSDSVDLAEKGVANADALIRSALKTDDTVKPTGGHGAIKDVIDKIIKKNKPKDSDSSGSSLLLPAAIAAFLLFK